MFITIAGQRFDNSFSYHRFNNISLDKRYSHANGTNAAKLVFNYNLLNVPMSNNEIERRCYCLVVADFIR